MAETGIPVTVPVLSTAGTASIPIVGGILAAGPATFGTLAIPIIGAAIAGISLAVGLWLNRKGPKQAEATTHIVDQAESFLKQYLAAWNSSNKTQAEKDLYLKDFWQIWQQVVDACSNDAYGSPGHACIEDRMPQGMTITAGGKTYKGNGKWNWFAYYFDPVNNYQVPSQGFFDGTGLDLGLGPTIQNLLGGTGINPMLLLAGLLVLGGVWYMTSEGN